jgi:Flp pilus assembly protein CpaB
VTLLVSPEQAETLTLANQEGRLQLVLRNGSDQVIEKTPGRKVAELFGNRSSKPVVTNAPVAPRVRQVAAVSAPPPIALKPAPPPPDEVVVIRGNQRSVEVIKGTN